jgi:hypothetical protein
MNSGLSTQQQLLKSHGHFSDKNTSSENKSDFLMLLGFPMTSAGSCSATTEVRREFTVTMIH